MNLKKKRNETLAKLRRLNELLKLANPVAFGLCNASNIAIVPLQPEMRGPGSSHRLGPRPTLNLIDMQSRQLYRLKQDYGRGYGVEALFTAHPEDIAELKGETVYFGEISGKHSEIECDINETTLNLVPCPSEIIEWIERNIATDIFTEYRQVHSFTISGHNPLFYRDYE